MNVNSGLSEIAAALRRSRWIWVLYSLRGKLQNTAGAAVLAAVGDFRNEDSARATAVDLATKNMPAAGHGTVLANADVVVGNWDAGTRTFTPAGSPMNSVRVVTRRSQANGNAAGLFFARVLGFDQVDMQATAIASSQGGGDSRIIALDPSVDDALRIAGTASVTMSCAARVNSTDNRAVRTNGGAYLELNGVLYAPNNLVRFAGNGDPGGATSIVARTVYFTGNANFGSNPATKLFGPGGANGISLVQ